MREQKKKLKKKCLKKAKMFNESFHMSNCKIPIIRKYLQCRCKYSKVIVVIEAFVIGLTSQQGYSTFILM